MRSKGVTRIFLCFGAIFPLLDANFRCLQRKFSLTLISVKNVWEGKYALKVPEIGNKK